MPTRPGISFLPPSSRTALRDSWWSGGAPAGRGGGRGGGGAGGGSTGRPGTDTDNGSVQARRFDADWQPMGSDFQVNTYTTGFQSFPWGAPVEGGLRLG